MRLEDKGFGKAVIAVSNPGTLSRISGNVNTLLSETGNNKLVVFYRMMGEDANRSNVTFFFGDH